MSYRIAYNPELERRYPLLQKKRKKPKIKTLLLILLMSVVIYTAVRWDITYYLIPGDPPVTIDAVSGLVKQIKTGEPIGDAVQCFVETVIQNGK